MSDPNVTIKPSQTPVDSTASAVPLQEISEPPKGGGTAARVQFGRPIPPQQQVLLYSGDEWEELILEWVHSQKAKYRHVRRFSGANDMGIDVAGLTDENGVDGIWDNFQCKHYNEPLTPRTAAEEVAKILWHSFNKQYASPRKYYFLAPLGCGTSLSKMMARPAALREHVITHWDAQCAKAVTVKKTIALDGVFKDYVEAFDFSIFSSRTLLEVIDDHRSTPYHSIRFGGGLPDRPAVTPPPAAPDAGESRYIQQLFEAYSDHTKVEIKDTGALDRRQDLREHLQRQREFFYHAEALRNFARDTVPPGTFEDLQTEVYAGVVDVEAAPHQDGYVRVNAVTQAASSLQLTSNPLISVIKVHDRKGICHQLANDDRLRWTKA